jgi:MerR family transcriptional regulator, redox-sensitive transcriptional activator SoxR
MGPPLSLWFNRVASTIGLQVRSKSRPEGGLVDDWPELTIGEVAKRAGVATSSIRYYESIGVLPEPDRLHGQRRYRSDVVGRLAFIGVAQGAGFKLREIKDLVDGLDGRDGMASQMRSLSTRKLPEIEALLERTSAMKGWLEVAKECGCKTPDECALFPAPGEEPTGGDVALKLVQMNGGDCRRQS